MLNAYRLIINYQYNINQCMHREQACRLSGTTVPWANLYRYSIYTGSTVYTTPVTCWARPYTGNVVDQTKSLHVLSEPLLLDLKEILICVVNEYRRLASASSNDVVECFDGEDGCPFLMCVMFYEGHVHFWNPTYIFMPRILPLSRG
jgi:hypothetical protein